MFYEEKLATLLVTCYNIFILMLKLVWLQWIPECPESAKERGERCGRGRDGERRV
jgi:hypothetical protein